MKKIIKSFLFGVLLLAAQLASAACYDNAGKVPVGSPPLFLQNGLWCTQQQPQVGVQVLQNSAVYVPNGGPAPQNYCPWSDRVANIGISALIGGFLGALATDTNRGAGQGAALGGFTGMFIPCPQPPQVVQVPRSPVNQGVPGVSTPPKLETSSFPSGEEKDTCRLRQNGNILAEIKLPLSVKREEAKEICDDWQKREAKSRGLI